MMHPDVVLTHLEYTRSDQRPILLDTDYQPIVSSNKNNLKRFEGRWLKEEGFREEVQRAWDVAGLAATNGVLAKLNHMHQALHTWDNKVLKRPKRCLRKAQCELDKALSGSMSDVMNKKPKNQQI
jgi:hypothetical protein